MPRRIRTSLRTSLFILTVLSMFLALIPSASAATCPTCGNYALEKTETKSEEKQVGCSVYNYHYKRVILTCSRNPRHVFNGTWTYTGRTFLRYNHLFDNTDTETRSGTVQVGCSVYSTTERRSRPKCSRCGATGSWSAWKETSRSFSHYNHDYSTEAETRSGTTQVGCSVYSTTEERSREKCSRCGATTTWSAWKETSRTFSHYSHLFDSADTETRSGTVQVGCSVYSTTEERARPKCSRCGATGSWSAWKETSRSFSHYSHDYKKDAENRTRDVKEGCSVYSISEARYRDKCSRCGSTTAWSTWAEVARNFLRYEHNYYIDTETQTGELQAGCDVYQTTHERTRQICSDCGSTTAWGNWVETSREFLRYEHDFVPETETQMRAIQISCSIYKITDTRTRQKCSRCPEVGPWGDWVETSRKFLRYEHDLQFESAEHETEYEWRGNEYWEVVYAKPLYVCYRCNEKIYGDRVKASETMLYKDTTAPNVSITDNYSGEWVGEIHIALTFTDSQSGVKTQQYSWSQSSSNPGTWNTYQANLTFTTGGIWYLHYSTEDNAGNSGTGYFGPYKIDKIPPAGNIIASETDWIYEVTVSSSDEHSGINRIYYKWTKEPETPAGWKNWASTSQRTAKLVPPACGTGWYLQVVIEDNAGNTTPCFAGPYQVDILAPEIIEFNPPSAPANCFNIEVEVTSISPGPSGIKETYWVWTRAREPIPPENEWTCITRDPHLVTTGQNEAGEWTLHVIVYNYAGKSTRASSQVYKLGTDEVTVHVAPASHPTWTRNGIGLEVTLEKTNSGGGNEDDYWRDIEVVACWQEVFQDGWRSFNRYSFYNAWYNFPIAVPSNGEWHLDLYAHSQGGNQYYPEEGIIGPFRHDSIAPVIHGGPRYVANDTVKMEIEIDQWSPTRRESYHIVACETKHDENWEYIEWLQLSGYQGLFWVKADDLPGYGVGDYLFMPGHSRCSEHGGTESVWSTSPTPPASGWVSQPDKYTSYKKIINTWYHHVRTWDKAGNIEAKTWGPFTNSSPTKPVYRPYPTAQITGPRQLVAGQNATYNFSGTAYTEAQAAPFYEIKLYRFEDDYMQGQYVGVGQFAESFNVSRAFTFPESGYYQLWLIVTDSLGRSANTGIPIEVTDPDPDPDPENPDPDPDPENPDPNPDPSYLTAALKPYRVKHGQQLIVFANSSEPDPWVQIWGQTHPMIFTNGYWQAQIPVAQNWPLGTNYLVVKNGIDTVLLEFQIFSTGPPRTRIVK